VFASPIPFAGASDDFYGEVREWNSIVGGAKDELAVRESSALTSGGVHAAAELIAALPSRAIVVTVVGISSSRHIKRP
jgi:hypothetical protein